MRLRSVTAVALLAAVGLPVLVAAAPFLAPGAFGASTPQGPSGGAAGTVVLSPDDVAAIAWRGGSRDWALVEAVAIAGAESHLTADALGDIAPIGGLLCPSHGLWQIRSCPGTPGGLDRGSRLVLVDPEANAAAAYRLFRSPRGFNHWSVYTSGVYLEWLPAAMTAARNWRALSSPPAPNPDPTGAFTPPAALPVDPRR